METRMPSQDPDSEPHHRDFLDSTATGSDVTIEPEFRQPKGSGDDYSGRSSRRLVGATLVVTALLLGWLLAESAPSNSADTVPAALAAPTLAETPATPRTHDSQSQVVERSEPLLPLRQEVPGFADTITALTWDNLGVGIQRWRDDRPAPEIIGSFDHGDGMSSRGLDASGQWFSEIRGDSVLVVHRLSDPASRHVGHRLTEESGGRRLWSAVWHDMRAGSLAWLACNQDVPGSSVALFVADATKAGNGLEKLRLVDHACADRGVWLARWGDWGFLLYRTERASTVQELLSYEGTMVAEGRFDPDGEWLVGIGSEYTTVWTEGPGNTDASSFVLSPDGLDRLPVPGLVRGERLESALVSPDGSYLGIVPDLVANYGSVVRIVTVDTGTVVAEITQPAFWVNGMVWSTDSRFLVYQRWPDVTSNWAGVPRDVELVFYNTEEHAGVALPLSGYAPLLRSGR